MSQPNNLVLTATLKFLKVAERTEHELRQHLFKKGFDEIEIDAAVQFSLDKGYVSDNRVVEREIELARDSRLIGPEKAKAKLLRRGADEDLVATTVADYNPQTEFENALRLLKSKPSLTTDPAKAARHLSSRGFTEEAIRLALGAAFPEYEW